MPKNKQPEKNIDNKKDLQKQTSSDNAVNKGYNEKNPLQPEGTFKPDSRTKGK